MPIFYNEANQEFHLQTSEASYIFHVLPNGQLGHLYYGKRMKHRPSFQHLYYVREQPNTANVFENHLDFSLDTVQQEYPSYGTTDFREPAYQIKQPSGSRITDFRYINHRIYVGKQRLEGLPATYVENEREATSVEVVLVDELIQMELILQYSVFEERNAITRSVYFTNHGDHITSITRAMSASIDFPDAEYDVMELAGSWARERHVKKNRLHKGIQKIGSTRGASSAQHNPFIALKRPHSDENQGEVYGFSFVYSGNFTAQVEVDHYDVTRVMVGINPFDFEWQLQPGESFQTPEVVMVFSNKGLNGMSQTFHSLYRDRLVRGKWRNQERPILINNWEATYFNFNEEKILEIAKQAKQVGIELLVLDDGWFGMRNDDTTSLGDWEVNKAKIPSGIKGLAKKVNEIGLDFGLWIEPEMVSKQSKLYALHPDWVIQVPGRRLSQGRNQYVLDLSNQEVVDYLYRTFKQLLEEASISYIKWDMNRYMTEVGSTSLPAYRQGEVAHRYMLGVYQLYEQLTSEFPDILFESCAAGGCRFDPGMLYYAPQVWTSDNTDAIERLKIQYGTSFVYPLSSMGAHVSSIPNHQVDRITSLDTRANVAYFGVFGYELDITKMDEMELQILRDQILFYKNNRRFLHEGTFYRLKSPFNEKAGSWMVVSRDKTEALVGYYRMLARANDGFHRLTLKGLDDDSQYELLGTDDYFYGDELMHAGIIIDRYRSNQEKGDFSSNLFHFLKREE
ncbi:alpha-galactosidase [Radiobacillus deserti]|uniref:Alpha-galactosidase n=1 Tax=Radiobacillus deserti TaxID=2594883 RepID=A0A516KE39_9BACI|nr:alpha-galactosidase [Radiobacillus deserti]QDP39637.1 alpha-galactosidase [Radiobacillus deserti]